MAMDGAAMTKVKMYCQRGDLTSLYSFIVQGILVTLAFLCLIGESDIEHITRTSC